MSVEPDREGPEAGAAPEAGATPEDAAAPEDAANLAARVEGRLDDLARRFDRSDWIELFAAVLLALATTVAAWSAYQATRWNGVQTVAFSDAAAQRAEANDAMTIAEGGLETDVEMFSTWVVMWAEGNDRGANAIHDRFRDEFLPAFDAWLAETPLGTIPPGRPFDLPQYDEVAGAAAREASALFRKADASAAVAREANQTGDNFVLTAVVMAAVLFFTGVSTKLRSHWVRVVMLLMAMTLFLVGVSFMFSLPQNVGI